MGQKVRKIGMKAEQREGAEYEFTTMLELEHAQHIAVATKDRTNLFIEPHVITADTGRRLRAWLDSGAPDDAPAHRAAPSQLDPDTLAKITATTTTDALRAVYQSIPAESRGIYNSAVNNHKKLIESAAKAEAEAANA